MELTNENAPFSNHVTKWNFILENFMIHITIKNYIKLKENVIFYSKKKHIIICIPYGKLTYIYIKTLNAIFSEHK